MKKHTKIDICYDKFNPELDKVLQNLDTKHLKKYTVDEYLEYIREITG